MFTLKRGDCLELMAVIPDKSVDLILCDLPYGTTACKWDTVIPFDELWRRYNRVIKPGAAIVLTSSQPFTTALISSNLKGFCYSWIWNKKFGANFAQAKRQPLKVHEDVLVFSVSGRMPTYYPEMVKRDKPIKKGKNVNESGAIPLVTNESYNGKVYDEKHPSSILEFSCRDKERGLHPTQKPIALMEYLIKTYTNEGDTVLDNCMGSGTTGVACANTNRRFIGMELDREYFRIARRRISEAYKTKAP
ncbi:DNA-methyltransferase [Escherichia coli]